MISVLRRIRTPSAVNMKLVDVLPRVMIQFNSTATPPPPSEHVETLIPETIPLEALAKIEKLELDLKDMKDKVLRSLAEEDNVRRIAKRDVENAKVYANSSFAKSLLEVADNLDLALKTGKSPLASEKDPLDIRTGANDGALLKSLIEGVEATNKGLLKSFAQFGIVKYGVAGEKFDPALHDALFQIPDDTKEAGTIGQVLQHGYKIKDRVLRAAQVGTVSHAPK